MSLLRRPSLLLATLAVAAGLFAVAPAGALAADRSVDAVNGTDVGTCGTKACKTVAYAVLWAAAGDRIVVHPGVYHEKITLNAGKTLISSGFPRATIDGDAGTAITVNGPGVRIENLYLRGDTHAVDVTSGADGTVVTKNNFDDQTANPTGKLKVAAGDVSIVGNAFSTDPASKDSEGVVAMTGGNAEISDNSFANFTGALYASSNPGHVASIHDNSVVGVHSPTPSVGYGIKSVGPGTVNDNAVSGAPVPGTASGINLSDWNGNSAALSTRRNRVHGFAASGIYAAVTDAGSTLSFTGDLLTENGTGITIYNGKPTIRGATIVDNVDREIYLGNATTPLKLVSTIVGDGGLYGGGSTCAITYSRGPSTTGTSCQAFQTSAAPKFAGPAGHYGLLASSPLIDAGEPGLAPGGELDVEGHPRIVTGLKANACNLPVRDIGAVEYVPASPIACPKPPVDPGPIDPGYKDPGTPSDQSPPTTPVDPGTPGTPSDQTPTTPQTPIVPHVPSGTGALTVIDDQAAAVSVGVDGGTSRTLAGRGADPARTLPAGPHTVRIAGRGARAPKPVTARVTVGTGQLAVLVVTRKGSRLVVRVTTVAAGARQVVSLLPGTAKVKVGTARARRLGHGAFATVPAAAQTVAVADQRPLKLRAAAQLTILVPHRRTAVAVVRAA